MKIKFTLLFFLIAISFSIYGQEEVIKLELLPTTYGEGMPLGEFEEFEKNIIKYINRIPRFELVDVEGKYDDVEYDATGGRLTIINSKEAETQTTSPYLLQLVFGDTDWSTRQGKSNSISINQYSTDSAPQQVYYDARVFLTLNLFDVSTGLLTKSVKLQAKSGKVEKYKKVAPGPNSMSVNAISSAQTSLWRKTKSAIHSLFPPEISIDKIVKQKDGKAEVLAIHGGGFYGLKKGNSIFIYSEQEYMVRGKPTNRSIRVAQVKLFKVGRDHCLGEVVFGQKALTKAVAKGVELKCIVRNNKHSFKGYGF